MILDEFDVRRCRTITVLNLIWRSWQEGFTFLSYCTMEGWQASYIQCIRGMDSWGCRLEHFLKLCNNG